jgi:hypothetical protein
MEISQLFLLTESTRRRLRLLLRAIAIVVAAVVVIGTFGIGTFDIVVVAQIANGPDDGEEDEEQELCDVEVEQIVPFVMVSRCSSHMGFRLQVTLPLIFCQECAAATAQERTSSH